MGWLTDDQEGQGFSRWVDELIQACLGAVCGLLFIVLGVAAWLIFEYNIQSVLRAAQEHFFG